MTVICSDRPFTWSKVPSVDQACTWGCLKRFASHVVLMAAMMQAAISASILSRYSKRETIVCGEFGARLAGVQVCCANMSAASLTKVPSLRRRRRFELAELLSARAAALHLRYEYGCDQYGMVNSSRESGLCTQISIHEAHAHILDLPPSCCLPRSNCSCFNSSCSSCFGQRCGAGVP